MTRLQYLVPLVGLILATSWAAEILTEPPQSFVYALGVAPKPERFLLVRSGTKYCAIRFLELWRGNDASAPTSMKSGEETFRAKYEWHELHVMPSGTRAEVQRSGVSEARREKLAGIGRLAFGGSDAKVRCAGLELNWTPPSSVYFYTGSKPKDVGIELATSDWKNVGEIQIDSPALTWYRLDLGRQMTLIPE